MSLFDAARRNPLLWLGAALVIVALVLSATVVVPETKQAVVIRFGKPDRIINVYDPRERFGQTGAGLGFKIPFFEHIVWVDKRVLDLDMPAQGVLSTDQYRLEVDAFARYRIVNPVRMYAAARNETGVSDALKPILGSALRNELGKRPFAVMLSPERDVVMENIKNSLARVAAQYGAEIVDVRIKRADLPDGSPLESAFNRMKSARQQQAMTIMAEGRRQAQVIMGNADATAAKIYADSFGKDPGFYDFYRAMQSYKVTFGTDDNQPRGSATILLSPDNDYLRQFMGRKQGQ
jgi:membrane protease subunit HflC